MTVSDSDDDCPPPLGSIEGQVRAARAGASRSDDRAVMSEEIVATVTAAKTSGPRQGAASSSSLRRGFFDAKLSTSRRKPKPPSTGASSSSAARDEIPTIVAKHGKPGIPDWLRVDTSAEQEAYQGLKNQLVEALKPNAETMNGIMQDPQLLAGFDDPEVMAAVNDIAQNPESFKKHAGNPKVAKFYAAMGQMMGERLEQKAAEKGS